MTTEENKRIATLTTGAIHTSMESAVDAMVKALEAAEEKTREMRTATEQFIEDFKKVTAELAHNVNSHVTSCQAAIDSFQEHHLKILNGDAQVPAPETILPVEPVRIPMPPVKPTLGPRPPLSFEDELGKLRALAPSAVDGRH
jgi:hypothetical protein